MTGSRRTALVALLGALSLGCPAEDDTPASPPADPGPDIVEPDDAPPPNDPGPLPEDATPDRGPDYELPPFTADCSTCHDLAALAAPVSTPDEVGAWWWTATHGDGLVRRETALASPASTRVAPWPERGHHEPAAGLEGCLTCHPVRDDGVGHGLRVYAYPERVFDPGNACAPACHTWLPADATVSAFERADGTVSTFVGSLRPADLLANATGGHAALWQEGARPDPAATHISGFNAGCGGCHNATAEAHGATHACLDCHTFGGPSAATHVLHVATIIDHQAELDPDGAAEGLTPCAYCHVQPGLGPTARTRRACYGCHLSGHQPLDAAGQAHFWAPALD